MWHSCCVLSAVVAVLLIGPIYVFAPPAAAGPVRSAASAGTIARASPSGPDVLPTGGDLLLDFTFRYDWVLPHSVTVRIGARTH